MATYTEKINRDTSSVSKFNSEDLSKKIVEMNRKIHDYLNKQKYYGNKLDSLEGHLFEGYEFSRALGYLIEKIGTLNLPPVEEYPDITEIEKIIGLCKKLLNIEEQEYELAEPVIVDDYGVEGVSIECKETEVFHTKLMELKKKYGITDWFKRNRRWNFYQNVKNLILSA